MQKSRQRARQSDHCVVIGPSGDASASADAQFRNPKPECAAAAVGGRRIRWRTALPLEHRSSRHGFNTAPWSHSIDTG